MVHGLATLHALYNWPKGKPIPTFIPKKGFSLKAPKIEGPIPAAIRESRNGFVHGWTKKECQTPYQH